jgi:hypothetical protein
MSEGMPVTAHNVLMRKLAEDNERKIARLVAEIELLRAAVSWIEPPFVDEKTPEAELRQRIAYAVADAKRAALAAQPAAPGGDA